MTVLAVAPFIEISLHTITRLSTPKASITLSNDARLLLEYGGPPVTGIAVTFGTLVGLPVVGRPKDSVAFRGKVFEALRSRSVGQTVELWFERQEFRKEAGATHPSARTHTAEEQPTAAFAVQ
jgi:hypothetical protein